MYLSISGHENAMLTLKFSQARFDKDAIHSEEHIVSVCAGLVMVERESQVICLVHRTAQDYFERKRRVVLPSTQVEIVETCIAYLELKDFESDELTNGEEHVEVSDKLHSKYPFLDYAGKYWGHHARGITESSVGNRIVRLLLDPLRLRLACDLMNDNSIGMRDIGPMPSLTVLVHFGLEHLIRDVSDIPDMTCAIRHRDDTLVFLLVENDEYWHDSGRHTFRVDCSSHRLEGNENMVRSLADKGVRIDLGVDNGEPILNAALLKREGDRRSHIPALLLELGAKSDPQILTYYTPLMRAVIEGNECDVWRVLKGGAKVNEKNQRGRDALIYAALARHEAVIGQLLEAGANVNSKDENNMTALSAACKGGNENIVKHLLKSGADISTQDRFGRTATSIAFENGYSSILQLLENEVTDSDSEDEVEAETGVMDENLFNKVWTLFETNDKVSGNRFVESVQRGA